MPPLHQAGFKRLFGEVVHAKRFERMVKEIELKVWVYNLMLGLSLTPLLSVQRGVGKREGGRVSDELGDGVGKLLNKTKALLGTMALIIPQFGLTRGGVSPRKAQRGN